MRESVAEEASGAVIVSGLAPPPVLTVSVEDELMVEAAPIEEVVATYYDGLRR